MRTTKSGRQVNRIKLAFYDESPSQENMLKPDCENVNQFIYN